MKRVLAACAMAATLLAGTAGHSQPADMGTLDVGSDLPAEIFIDGQDTKQQTPPPPKSKRLPVTAGHHSLTLTTLDQKHTSTIGFKVDRNGTFTIVMHLAP
jgi:hypothetical protein